MSVDAALNEIALFLGNRLSRSKADLESHGRSESHFPLTLPDGVAYPANTGEVSRIAEICSHHGCPIIGWGVGTSLEGHALAFNGGLVVDFRDMNKVLAVHAQDMDVVVQPGITREELGVYLRDTGLFFPVDPGANATLGGMAATRSSGTTSVRYGTMRDNVMGCEVVLADGRVMRCGSRARKSSTGYDLTRLMVGSEGTLGLMTELTLKLQGQPEAISAAICGFSSIDDAVDAVIATIQMGVPMARIEFVDETMVQGFNIYAGAEMPEVPHLLIEFHGSDRGVAEDVARFKEIAEDFGCLGVEWAVKAEDRTALWAMRHNALYACMALKKGARSVITDICVPISNLAQAVKETRADIDASPVIGPLVGHVGDGNVHAVLLVDPGKPSEMDAALGLAQRMAERALRLSGTVSGEHGIGVGKLGFMAAEHGEAWGVMADIKRALDPGNIMNPGKVVQIN